MKCFCNGLNVDCQSSDLFYGRIQSEFLGNDDEWQIKDRNSNELLPLQMNGEAGVKFVDFQEHPEKDFYFLAPKKFLGNKIGSYGGNLTFKVVFEGSSSGHTKKVDVRISVSPCS